MTFDEWWLANHGPDTLRDTFDGVYHKDALREVWDAATAAERERAAKVVVQYGLADDTEGVLGLLTETAGMG